MRYRLLLLLSVVVACVSLSLTGSPPEVPLQHHSSTPFSPPLQSRLATSACMSLGYRLITRQLRPSRGQYGSSRTS